MELLELLELLVLKGHLAHKKTPPPLGPPQEPRYSPGPRRGLFLMSEVPLYANSAHNLLSHTTRPHVGGGGGLPFQTP